MNTTAKQRALAILIATALFLLTLAFITGCEAMQRFDRQIADAIAVEKPPVTTQPGRTVTEPPDPPPPFMEITAGILALLGYGGLAQYIRSTKKNGKANLDTLWEAVHAIQDTLDHKED